MWELIEHPFFPEVAPTHDIRPHIIGGQCWCCPELEQWESGRIGVVHYAADGREAYEKGARKPH